MIDEAAVRGLVERARSGDTKAFTELVDSSKLQVFRLAYNLTGSRLEAEDLSQDVFIKAFRALADFRGDAKWSTWLHRITVNTCMDHGRSVAGKKHDVRLGNEDENQSANREPVSAAPLPDRTADSSMIQSHIDSALDVLTDQERSVFVLRHYHDYSLQQIAETLDIAEGTVKSYLFRAVPFELIHALRKR